LGSGKRLFDTESGPLMLMLVDMQTTSTGVVVNTYERSGPQNDDPCAESHPMR
jgi:hypothetical protein